MAKRQLLLALAGVAATSVTNSLAMSTDESTFTRTVAAFCEIGNLAETKSLFYVSDRNFFTGTSSFSIHSNAEVDISMNTIATNNEVANVPTGTYPWARLQKWEGAKYTNITSTTATKSRPSDRALAQNTINQISANYRIDFWLMSGSSINNRHQLLPGSYSYTVTINCLL